MCFHTALIQISNVANKIFRVGRNVTGCVSKAPNPLPPRFPQTHLSAASFLQCRQDSPTPESCVATSVMATAEWGNTENIQEVAVWLEVNIITERILINVNPYCICSGANGRPSRLLWKGW